MLFLYFTFTMKSNTSRLFLLLLSFNVLKVVHYKIHNFYIHLKIILTKQSMPGLVVPIKIWSVIFSELHEALGLVK